ncbi:MAG: alpha-glucuronidase [Gammaproteobacteria bacterium]|jgi:alpha-glucuronidase|nr:alpha-glucuronidase [Gammaproteobacteria bacterium]
MKTLAAARLALFALAAVIGTPKAHAEDGYDLWLRYRPVASDTVRAHYRQAASEIVGRPARGGSGGRPSQLATLDIAQAELSRGLTGLLGAPEPIKTQPTQNGSVILGTPQSSPLVAGLGLPLDRLGPEGYLIRSLPYAGHQVTVIAANSDVGVLYGTFHFLRLIQTQRSLDRLDISAAPRVQHRILNHWDNLDRSVERGFAGQSIWDWHKLPDFLDPRYTDYARACASLGINGTVPINVNPSPIGLTAPYLRKYAALADVFRPYGLRIYLTARFSAPLETGGLKTADPLDPAVRAWWKAKADEIYALIPDFGGFLVKANSEGQPGPQDYHRTHAEGANMLADAVALHGGIIMWRAFVYSQDEPQDRAKQAYSEFIPLDGQFRDNVVLQVKNGAIDFQPREPFHPLFGATPHTPLMLEVQVTKEYLGFATHLVYLGPLFEETLRSDTFAKGPGSTVARVIDGSLFGYHTTGMAGVSNIGSDRDWTGSHFDQANWYAFGRMAWDPLLASRDIAEDWVKMTFSTDPAFVEPVVNMMMGSREAAVDYMTPLGLHHQMARSSHYGPGPWVSGGPRADWTSTYYNRADAQGIGFDRTATGSDAVSQYAKQVASRFADLKQTPQQYLLWFHHVPWDYRLAAGHTLWDELVMHYSSGVQTVTDMRKTWAGLDQYVDAERYAQISAFLAIQEREAKWWRDASIAYFQTFSHRPLPAGYAPPEHDLQYYESLCFPYAPGSAARPSATCN